MNKRFLSTLLFGALFVASTSMFVSCKDYDDDIKNLQTQIDRAALKSEVESLQSTLTTAAANAQAAADKALEKANANETAIAAVREAAEKAGQDAAQAIAAATAAAENAAAAAEAARAADEAAKAAAREAAQAQADASLALEQLATLSTTYVTASSLREQLESLLLDIASTGNSEAELAALKIQIQNYEGAIEELYSAVTGVDLIDSYSGWYDYYTASQGKNMLSNYLNTYNNPWTGNPDIYGTAYFRPVDVVLTHGLIPETSVFGDNELKYTPAENSHPLIEYKEGDDIKDPQAIIVRVNPVNADITSAKIVLLNSKGETLEDVVAVGVPQKFDRLITRGSQINSGLWYLPLEVAPGVTDEIFAEATQYVVAAGFTTAIQYAVGINNTEETDADRYVVSSYDLTVNYQDYIPANHFTFNVQNTIENRSVELIHNRWDATTGLIIAEENAVSNENPELEWRPFLTAPVGAMTAPVAVPASLYDIPTNVMVNNDYWNGVGCIMDDSRVNEQLIVAAVGEKITINSVAAFTEYGTQVNIDSMYVVLDKVNAIESAPSEINAWNSYTYTGLNKTVDASKPLSISVESPSADGDIIGFRVFAVNRDGSLVDPDGRAFYILVSNDPTGNAKEAEVWATKAGNFDTSDAMDFAGSLNGNFVYKLKVANTPVIVDNWANPTAPTLNYFQFNWTNNLGATVSENFAAVDEAVVTTPLGLNVEQLTITPQNIENLLDEATYTFTLTGYEIVNGITWVPRTVTTIKLTKKMPLAAKALEFRPKQEMVDGTGKFKAYMIPNKGVDDAGAAFYQYWAAPWVTTFAAHSNVAEMRASYNANLANLPFADNGFKNLTNVFYNLSENGANGFAKYPYTVYDPSEWDTTYEFIFKNALHDYANGGAVVDLLDGNGEGIKFNQWSNRDVEKYMLDVETDFIDDVTEHEVVVATVYPGISTELKIDGTVDHFNRDYRRTNEQNLTAIFSCWHFANTYAWKKNTTPQLQWKHEGNFQTGDLANILSDNSYDPGFFGKKTVDTSNNWTASTVNLENLIIDWEFLTEIDPTNPGITIQLNTKPDGSGQINPYFVPFLNFATKKIEFTQISTQTDAAPVANHGEYLIIRMRDAFGHVVEINNLTVNILRP